MFTGIVEQMGTVTAVEASASGRVLEIDADDWDHRAVPGESIAVDGCCLTVASLGAEGPGRLRFDVIHQTLKMTVLGGLAAEDRVNLEHAATVGTLLGGHVVQGHIDGIGVVERVSTDEEGWRVRIRPPADLLDAIVPQGSIAVAGVSLTVAALDADVFEVALIPTTLELTTLGRLETGDRLNLETDYLVKAVVNYLRRQDEARG
ncbi:MAG: riboflavin synthase [Planctomycetota bacterium]|jgi:riboflavin synthase